MPGMGGPRLHALDGLRAAMMLLGLVLHSAASYATVPLASAWPFQDRTGSPVFDVLLFTIHLFRMPVFFVMAGFFAALLLEREGARGFLQHRTRRILLPLVVAWVVLCPLILWGFSYAGFRAGVRGAVAPASRLPRAMREAGLVHLWFLWDLLILSVAALPVVAVGRRLPGLGRGASALCALAVRHPAGLLILFAVTALTLLPMRHAGLDTATGLLPPPRVLAAYGVFFAFGWFLYGRRELVPAFAGRAWPALAGATLTAFARLAWGLQPGAQDTLSSRLVGIALASASIWLFAFAFIGLFVRYFDRPRPLQRWLADGAYWIYLVHLPFTIWVPALLAPLDWPAGAKFAVTLGLTTLATTGSYWLFVRATWVGQALNGRRMPRALPREG
jgi:glucan biosynthesis protein C